MKKSKSFFSCLCAGVLVLGILTGCSEKGTVGIGNRLETGEVQENSVVIHVGDTSVRYREVRNYCYLLKEQYESSFGKKIWNYELDDGSTIGDEAKEEIIEERQTNMFKKKYTEWLGEYEVDISKAFWKVFEI